MALAKWKCVNLGNCPKADSQEEFEIAAGEHEPTCECGGALLRVGRARSRLSKLLVAVSLTLAVIVGVVLISKRSPTPSPSPPSKASVVVVIDGQLLNAVMVRTPEWLGERAASFPNSEKALALGLWACRPLEPNGEIKTALRNYSPTLMPLADFKTLQIPIAPKPELWPENLRKGSPSYDLLSNLKTVLQETRWDSPTNRFLVIVTESSAFPKSSGMNAGRIDEQEVKKLADQANVKICAVHVLVPNDLLADDQRVAEQQLRVLSEDGGRYYYYQVHKSSDPAANTGSEFEMVTAYAGGIKAAFGQILDQVAEGSRKSR